MIPYLSTLNGRLSRRALGVVLAFATATVSGVSVFVNSRAVKHFDDATVYTTAKNAVAGALLLLLALAVVGQGAAGRDAPRTRPGSPRQWLALLALAAVGGSLPFVLFFEGLARAEATQAAFIHKTLVVWVALLAVPLLRERFGVPHAVAVVLLIVGQAWIAGDAGTLVFGAGEAMILAATLLWAVEVVFVKHLLGSLAPRTLAAARMGLGTAVLGGWVAVTGKAGDLVGLGAEQWQWALLTGLLLTAYVATWYAALALAQAVDVTAVLVFGAVVTAFLARAADGAALDVAGVALITVGSALAGAIALRERRPEVVRG
jgi:drug/metabolite transporter (DMT)-like permease